MNILCIALVWLTGLAVCRALLAAPLRWSAHNALLLSLSGGVGIGIASSIYFLCLALVGPKLGVLAALEAAALVAALALAIVVKRRGTLLDWGPGPATPWYLTGLLLLAAALAVTMFLVTYLNKPHGEWDAWSIWNMRARFFYRAGEFWQDAFSTQIIWTHPDYPLLLPGIVAMCWTLARQESTNAPAVVALLFTFGAAGVLISTLGVLRGKTQSFVAGILLLCTASFIQIGSNQYADVPLSFYILATLALLCLQDRYPDDFRFTILAGLTAGFAAWTKNEGLQFVLALVIARVVAIMRYGNRAALVPGLLRLAAGLLPPLAAVAFFKLRYAPANDLIATGASQVGAHLIDVGRWMTVIEGFVKSLIRMHSPAFPAFGSFLIPVVLVLGLYWYLLRFKVDDEQRTSLATVVLALGLMLAGDFAIYILFPLDVAWQVNTSLERLLLQVWPAALLAFFLAANPPQLVPAPVVVEKPKQTKRHR
jgi:hypothetical protein